MKENENFFKFKKINVHIFFLSYQKSFYRISGNINCTHLLPLKIFFVFQRYFLEFQFLQTTVKKYVKIEFLTFTSIFFTKISLPLKPRFICTSKSETILNSARKSSPILLLKGFKKCYPPCPKIKGISRHCKLPKCPSTLPL